MAQLYRDQFATYFNTADNELTPDWNLEGTGVDSLAMSFNPQIDQYKTIIDRNSSATFKNYQIQSAVSGKRIYSDDPIYVWLDKARREAKAIETQMLGVDMADKIDTSFTAIKYKVLIVINEFLGEDATISYDLYVQGDPIQGTATISGKKPTFVETV